MANAPTWSYPRFTWRQAPELSSLLASAGLLRTLQQASRRDGALMPIELTEDAQAYLLTVELPGCSREDIHVTLDGARVAIRVRDEALELPAGHTLLHAERAHGPRSRTVQLAHAVDADNAHGSCRDGVLTLHLPKQDYAPPAGLRWHEDPAPVTSDKGASDAP